MARLVTKAELARRAGVSKPAISRACKVGPLRVACSGDRVDLDHPAVAVAYPQAVGQPAKGEIGAGSDQAAATTRKAPRRRDVAPAAPPAGGAKAEPKPAPTPTVVEVVEADELTEEIQSLGQEVTREELQQLNRALRPILAKHGTRRAFKDWLGSLKLMEDIRKQRLDNEETEGRLISRELVKAHIFGSIEGSHLKLLGDAPKTITRIVYALAESQEAPEVAEARVRDVISKILKPVKATAARVIENA